MTDATVRRLLPEDADALARLRRAALEGEALAFGSSPADDVHGAADAFRRSLAHIDETAVFGAFESGALVGMVGIGRSAKAKRRHKADVWGLYVAPSARRRGLARRLLAEAIGCAREWPGLEQLLLSVTTAAPGARRLYESVGFRPWGREPRGIRWQGRDEDEDHFVLELLEGRRSPCVVGIDHVQLAMPAGQEDRARSFYAALLGLTEVAKPEHLAARGGAWFESGGVKVHLGVDREFRPAKKAHPGLLVADLEELTRVLEAAGHATVPGEPLAGYVHCYVDDPFGNRLELLQRVGPDRE